ncbi:MAG: ComF family protein [Deltaproteobacteria bacterium]|nr:ComF family protein [Deltaproteobacteria bacterium]
MNAVFGELRGFLDGLVDVAFPRRCASCSRIGASPFCASCHAALVEAGDVRIPRIDLAAAAFEYGGPVVRAIWRLKYEGRAELGHALGSAMRAKLSTLEPFDVVAPIPLSPSRQRTRGYNQALELAIGLRAGKVRLGLLRKDDEGRQVGRTREARREHARGAFLARGRELAGRRVLLVDDVVTTGATLEAAAEAARQGGARSVQAIALARAEARWSDDGRMTQPRQNGDSPSALPARRSS